MAVMHGTKAHFTSSYNNEPFVVIGPVQPLLEEPLPKLITFTCYLLAKTNLSYDYKVGLLEPGGLLGPTTNPPNIATYQALHTILPCNFACGTQYLGQAEDLTATEIRLLLKTQGIPRMSIINRMSLQLIKAAEYIFER